METKKLSNKTFSNQSFDNWQSKRCDFCMYHELIFGQLERLKEAILIKNQRILQLEGFIAKISQMAFVKNAISPMSKSTNANTDFISRKINESSQQFQNESLMNYQKSSNALYFRKKFEESSQISFSESKLNTAKFETKVRQNSSSMSDRFQKINQLKQMKKSLHKKMLQNRSMENSQVQKRIQSFSNTQQFDTMRSLSLPQQEGHINSITDCSCQNSRVKQFSQLKSKFQGPDEIDGQIFIKSQSAKTLQLQSRSSINIIKQYIKNLK